MKAGSAAAAALALALLAVARLLAAPPAAPAAAHPPGPLFVTGDRCMACHNGLLTPAGEEFSFGADWRASMMANSARDPYWQAGVRREVTDHPESRAAIENECSRCHMPMANVEARAAGGLGGVFVHLPPLYQETGHQPAAAAPAAGLLAADGVSCTVCHQIQPGNLGTRESLVGGFEIDLAAPPGERTIFGPFEIDAGRTALMRSAVDYRPAAGAHVQSSELCATCHTLITHSLGPGGEVIGELPEQVPYEEWLHSAYREERSCQSCHMPVVAGEMPIASVLGEPRAGVSRHTFRGANFFMLRLLNRYRAELGVAALPHELDAAARRTEEHLASESARVAVARAERVGGRLEIEVAIDNLAGHKLPTAYPSRRAWLHLVVRDRDGRAVFESGALGADAAIAGNDNDEDAARFEPHHERIERPDQVQVYETIMAGPDGAVTTGLLTAVRFVKDNRLLPHGFDKATAGEAIAVHGAAAGDPDFTGGGDRVRYRIDPGGAPGPFTVEAALWYQPIAYRWARNLEPYAAAETARFAGYYRAMARSSAIVLARGAATVE